MCILGINSLDLTQQRHGRNGVMIAIAKDQKALIGKAARQFRTKPLVIHFHHGQAPQIFAHFGWRRWPATFDIHLWHIDFIIGPMRRHGFNIEKQRLAGLGAMLINAIEHIGKEKTIAFIFALITLHFTIGNVFKAYAFIKTRHRHEGFSPGREHDSLIAAFS